VTITWAPGDAGQPPRVAFAVGRVVGGAVVRNRVRRRLRAISVELAPVMHPGVYLLSAGREAASLPYEELKRAVSGAMEDLPGGRAS
jgi:ribonuclease P protein component